MFRSWRGSIEGPSLCSGLKRTSALVKGAAVTTTSPKEGPSPSRVDRLATKDNIHSNAGDSSDSIHSNAGASSGHSASDGDGASRNARNGDGASHSASSDGASVDDIRSNGASNEPDL
jgi:hypothetical protein